MGGEFVTRLALVCVLLAGCRKDTCEQTLEPESSATGTAEPFADYDAEACVPDEETWATLVAPVVEQRCGACHGDEAAFGAPQSLMEYTEIVAGTPGNRPADRMAFRSAMLTMPPANATQLEHDELDLLVEWATCGEVHPDPSIGLAVDRPVYAADVPENADLPSFEVRADGFSVQADTLDHYQCFSMEIPVDEPRYIKRIQVALHDSRVLHHVVVHHDPDATSEGNEAFGCDGGGAENTQQLWAWAPGTGAFDFEEGGLPIHPGERLVLEIHYNNGAGLKGVVDSSGVRIFHGPVEGVEWTLAALGPEQFEVPEGDSAVCDEAEVFGPRRILAGMPHMHELGAEFDSWIERADGDRDELIHLTGWSFEAQLYYLLDTPLYEGDVLHTRCGFRNDTGKAARSGLGTADEMCFNFAFIGPQ